MTRTAHTNWIPISKTEKPFKRKQSRKMKLLPNYEHSFINLGKTFFMKILFSNLMGKIIRDFYSNLDKCSQLFTGDNNILKSQFGLLFIRLPYEMNLLSNYQQRYLRFFETSPDSFEIFQAVSHTLHNVQRS